MSSEAKNVWGMASKIQSGSALREHVSLRAWHSSSRLEIACQGLLLQPVISISPSTDWVFKSSKFTISCFMQPVSEYPGFFELIFTTSKTTRSYTQKAVNHSVHFPFPAADHSHEGNYSCVYHVYLMSREFSTVSQSITLRISDSPTVFIIRLVGLVLTLALFLAIYLHKKVIRRQEIIALEDIGASNAERRPNDEAGFEESNLRGS
ncbi:uncharacterized protein LOC113162229 [Anabas testudineus]|uniref:uncharacterized protein LOC113162229 n=1 Tax=Anabas testudineus TaxID=64144 RepID=UPI000E464797|nr:uncharacterized protein LOC113162229 [Anabas testudineus]